jgi:hypothetical protein
MGVLYKIATEGCVVGFILFFIYFSPDFCALVLIVMRQRQYDVPPGEIIT